MPTATCPLCDGALKEQETHCARSGGAVAVTLADAVEASPLPEYFSSANPDSCRFDPDAACD